MEHKLPDNYKISYKNLPSHIPFWQTIIVFLLLDRLDAPDWFWGVAGTLVVIWWIFVIIRLYSESEINIFSYIEKRIESVEKSNGQAPRLKSRFQQMLEDAKNATRKSTL